MTEKIPAEVEALCQQHDFSTSLLNTAPVIVLLLDIRGMIEYANPYFEQLSGYRLDEIRGKEWFSTFLPVRDQDNIRALFRKAAHDVPTRGYINPIVTRSGAELEIEWYSQTMRDAQGNIISVLNTGQDVTGRRIMEKALHFSAARLNEAQHLARLGSWELDLVKDELLWSDEVFSLFEIEKSQFGNTYANFLSVIHPDDRESVNLAYTRSLETRGSYEITHRLCMPDGRIKWMHERCITEFDALGNALRSIGTVQDVTERQLAQAALQQLNAELEQRVAQRTAELLSAKNEAERANSAKSEFLSRMSYQLRTPMNGILGFTQLLAYDATNSLDMQQADYVQEILRSGEHLLELINDVLDLARIESGHIELVQEPLAVAQMVRECVALVQKLAAPSRVTLGIDITGDYVIRADRPRLRQILLNLLSNAVKYNRENGSVKISCRCVRDGWARVSVQDSGYGITTEALPRLFQPFERLQPACDAIEDAGIEGSDIGGSGVGLVLSRKLAEAMGGTIGVESVSGTGSTFWVEFPLLVADHDAKDRQEFLPDPGAMQAAIPNSRTVLYIEDNPSSVRLVQQSISGRLGLVMHSAHSAELGLEMARAHRPDIILLDINLPGMNGFEALSILQNDSTTRDIPVVAITANAMERDIKKGLDAGFVDYLTKPLDIIQLVLVLSKLAERQRAVATSKH